MTNLNEFYLGKDKSPGHFFGLFILIVSIYYITKNGNPFFHRTK